jgi:enoyl-CoA hydratase/carnithine racemase
VRASKEAALAGLGRPLEEAMSARYEGLAAMVKSEDFLEGPRAFAEKRSPRWKAR